MKSRGCIRNSGSAGSKLHLSVRNRTIIRKKLAEQYQVPFHFWVDTENRAARMLGIDNKYGVPMGMPGYDPDTVFPTVVITDEEGEIIFVDETDNYRIRPEPQTFLDILDVYIAGKNTATA